MCTTLLTVCGGEQKKIILFNCRSNQIYNIEDLISLIAADYIFQFSKKPKASQSTEKQKPKMEESGED